MRGGKQEEGSNTEKMHKKDILEKVGGADMANFICN